MAVSTGKIIGWTLGIGATIAVIIGLMPNGWLRNLWNKITAPSIPPSGTRYSTTRTVNDNVVTDGSATAVDTSSNKCVLRNANGHEITITSDSNNELFRKYCLQNSFEPYYYNYVYYYPVNWWGWRGHGRGGRR